MKVIKKLIPLGLKKFIYRNFPPYNFSIPSREISPDLNISVSDCFLYRGRDYETIFVGENNIMTLLLEPIECHHELIFFNEQGILKTIKRTSMSRSVTFDLSNSIDCEYCNFIHQIRYSKTDKDKVERFLQSGATLQTRGYTGYRKLGNIVYTYVHGNFGGLHFKNQKVNTYSLQRVLHSYTPQYQFEPGYDYEVFFQNPTDRDLLFEVINQTNNKTINREVIQSLGFSKTDFNVSEPTTLTWKSKLPIGRALIFENNPNSNHIDVFHS